MKLYGWSSRDAAVALLIVVELASSSKGEAEITAAVGERLTDPDNPYPAWMLAGLATALAADLMNSQLGDKAADYMADSFDPTGPVLACRELVAAALVWDDDDPAPLKTAVARAIRNYGGVLTVAAAVMALRNVTHFVFQDKPPQVSLDEAAGDLVRRTYPNEEELA